MPFANNHGVNIHYEVEGHGPPLVLVHGFSGNRTSWRGYGFVDKLKDDYTLILIDARAHGVSDKPHQPEAYALPLLVADVLAVLDDLRIDKTHFLGYSMGGTIGFGLAKEHPDRLRSAIIGGASPYNRGDPNEPDFLLELYERGLERGVEAIVEGIRAWAGSITPEYEERLRSADIRAGVAHLRWLRAHPPDFAADLSHITTPCLLYAGAADEPTYTECQECVAQMPNATFLGLPDLNHVGTAGASDLLVPHIKRFLAAIP